MTTVNVRFDGQDMLVTSEYHPDLPKAAKLIGGSFKGKDGRLGVWQFDKRDEVRVRNLYKGIYGTDGTSSDVLTIRAPGKVLDGRSGARWKGRYLSYWLAGQQIAFATGRDSGGRLGDGVIVLQGSVGSGGSVKNPACVLSDDLVVEIRDVPADAAREVHAKYHGVTLLDADGNVVVEATTEEPAQLVDVVAEPRTQAESVDVSSELDQLNKEIADAEERLAQLYARRDALIGNKVAT